MNPRPNTTTHQDKSDQANLDALDHNLDLSEEEEEVVEKTSGEEHDEDIEELALDPEDERHLEERLRRAEIYEEQEAPKSVTKKDEEEAPKRGRGRPRTKEAAAPKPKINRDISALEDEHFVLDTRGVEDNHKNKLAIMGKRPGQKKVAEKFDNLLISLAHDKKPSVYVMQAFELLDEKKEITSGDIVAKLRGMNSNKGTSYDEGTARSQAGQIMALFPILEIASRDKQTLKLNKHSSVAKKLRVLVGSDDEE